MLIKEVGQEKDEMSDLYYRYQQGFHQEVYQELLALGEHIFDASIYEDALLVGKEMMRRVRQNIELLVPRLEEVGYQFGKGFWNDDDDLSPEEKATIAQDVPLFQAPGLETSQRLSVLERLVGTLPLSLRCWYAEVGAVNLVGLFSTHSQWDCSPHYGCVLDPLFVYSLEMAIKMVSGYIEANVWQQDPTLPLAPDNLYKYSFSGSGTYSIALPCRAFDAPLLLERHHTTFIDYLRLCFQWGGFPGLERENRLPSSMLAFLTQDFQRF